MLRGKKQLLFGPKDRSLAALLGASPGASTSATLMIDLLGICFPEEKKTDQWQAAIKKLIPSYGLTLGDDREELARLRSRSESILRIGDAQG